MPGGGEYDCKLDWRCVETAFFAESDPLAVSILCGTGGSLTGLAVRLGGRRMIHIAFKAIYQQ